MAKKGKGKQLPVIWILRIPLKAQVLRRGAQSGAFGR
jgi:hypothetical protein